VGEHDGGEPVDETTSMLAATALGLAVTSGLTEANARTLATLAAPDPPRLSEARRVVLDLDVAPYATRALASRLLHRATWVAGEQPEVA
jgi:hypothetical protein